MSDIKSERPVTPKSPVMTSSGTGRSKCKTEDTASSVAEKPEINDAVTKALKGYQWPLVQRPTKSSSEEKKSHVKRPMNAFMVWAQAARRLLADQHPHLHNADLSKQLGEMWRKFTDDQKKPFLDEAEQLRKIHKETYPNYKYQPRRKTNVKTNQGEKQRKNIQVYQDSFKSDDSVLGSDSPHSTHGPLTPPTTPSMPPKPSPVYPADTQPGFPLSDVDFVCTEDMIPRGEMVDSAELDQYFPGQNISNTWGVYQRNDKLEDNGTDRRPRSPTWLPGDTSASDGSRKKRNEEYPYPRLTTMTTPSLAPRYYRNTLDGYSGTDDGVQQYLQLSGPSPSYQSQTYIGQFLATYPCPINGDTWHN